MKKDIKFTTAAELRRQAVEQLKAQKRPPQSDTDTQKLIHELQVHQIELELQNEELNLSRTEVEAGLVRYTDLYDFAPVGYFTLTRDGTISQSNLTGACLIGVERARLVNRRFGLFVSEADLPNFNAFLERVFEGKAEEVCEVALLKEDSGPLWVRMEAQASEDRQDCRAVLVDITERKRAEEFLRKSEEKMRSIFRVAPTGIGAVVNRVFTEVNQRLCDMTGYTHDELIGQSARMIYPSDADYEYVGRENFGQIAKTGTGAVETRFRRKDGTVIDVLLSSTPMDAADLSRGVTFTALDITERKRASEALQQRVEELAALNVLGRAVNATLSMEETMVSALQGMLNAVHPDMAFIFLREGDKLIQKRVLPPSARQWLDAIPEHRVGECLCGLAVREKKPQYSMNIFNDPRCTWEECKKAGIKSFAALPLNNGDEVIGVIGLASDVERDYGRQAEFLETLAGQVSVALANVRLFEIAQLELDERKRAEEALRESEDKHRILLEQSPDPIFSFTPEGRYKYVNRAFAEGVGKKVEDIIGRMIWDVFSKEEADKRFASLSQVVNTGKEKVIEVRVPRADGDRHYLTTITPIKDPKGRVLSAICSSKEITDRKRAEEALRESELRFRNIFESAVEGIFQSTMDGHYLTVNPSFARMCGFDSPEQMIDAVTSLSSLYVHPEDREEIVHLLRTVGEVKNYEAEINRQDGNRIWISIHAKTVRDEKGNPPYIDGTVEDITERKQAEEKLRHVLMSARCILWHAVVTDRVERGFQWDLRITNEEAAEKMFPLPRKPGQRYSDVWRHGTPKEDIERMDRTSMQAIRQGRAGYVQEFRLCLPSGEIRWLSEDARIQSIRPHSWLVVGVCTDITERKRAEEAIQEQMDELRRWHEATLGRETRVLDLKREVNELLAKSGQPPRYASTVTDNVRSDRDGECGVRNKEQP